MSRHQMISPASSKPRQPSLGSSSSPTRLRLVLLALAAAAFFLVPVAQAAAAESFPLEVEVSGEGNVTCSANAGPPESCESEYEEGTDLTLLAEPEQGSEFLEWQGDCDAIAGNECEVEMNEAKTIEAVFALEEFEVTVATEGSGEGAVECEVDFGPREPCPASESYPFGTALTLYAEAEPGSQFTEWGGDCSGEEAECELTVEEPLSVTATFEPGPFFVLTVETEGGSGKGKVECEVEGSAEECEAAGEYVQGTVVTLRAEAEPGSEFVEWLGECDAASGNECEVEVSEDRTVEAVFDAKPPVSLAVNLAGTGEGEVECEVNGGPAEPCEVEYPEGTELALVATPEAGSKFAGYSAGTGSAAGCTTSPCAFTIEADSEVTATFDPIAKFALKVKKGGTGSGTITSSPAAIACPPTCSAEFEEGTTIILTATPDLGSEFVEWLGCDEATGNKCKETISAAKEVTAIFNLVPPTKFALKVKKIGTGTGKVESTSPVSPKIVCGTECEKEFNEGTKVTLTQSAEAGSEFIEWGGACTGSGACEVTMSAAKEVTAKFDLKAKPEFKLTIAKAGTGSGSVTCNAGACAATYPGGTEVTLTASAASGSTFAGWSGAGCSGTASCKVTLNADTTVTATFNKEEVKPPPPTEGTAKAAATAKVKSGKAELKLTCSGGPCKGTLQLKAKVKQGKKTKTLVIGKASFSLAEGATATVKVKLSGPAKQELAKGKTLKAKVTGTGITASTVKLKLAKKK
jgi:hypothetical protein